MGKNSLLFSSIALDYEDLYSDTDENDLSFETMTHDIRVIVRPFWLEEHSSPEQNHYSWAYQVQIENHNKESMCLLHYSWDIIDSSGHIQHIESECIIEEAPRLEPGEVFEYISSMSLNTPSGFMRGYYKITSLDSGEIFEIDIPSFSLDSPHQFFSIH